MNEARFRSLMREAVGDESMRPWLSEAVRDRIRTPKARTGAVRLMLLVAAALVLMIVAGMAAPRLLNRGINVVPTATPPPIASPTPFSAFNCTLPVQAGKAKGFVNTATGVYTADPSAAVDGLPGSGGPLSYDSVVHRWLPVDPRLISPDGTAYAYLAGDGPGIHPSDVRVYDLRSGIDRKLFTGTAIGIFLWGADGIHVIDSHGPVNQELLIDPDTGAATTVPERRWFGFTPLPGDPPPGSGWGFRTLGWTNDGRQIWWFYNLGRPGAVDWVFYESAPGVRVYIYKGEQGDATGFDPGDGYGLADTTGIWFTDQAQRPLVWHWSQGTGLRKVVVRVPGGAQPRLLSVVPAGSCF